MARTDLVPERRHEGAELVAVVLLVVAALAVALAIIYAVTFGAPL